MFKTKGFSANNSLKRRAVIVDAPDLPPEECEFYITSAGIADSDKVETLPVKEPLLEFEVKDLYEDNGDEDGVDEVVSLLDVKGIGKSTVENLKNRGISGVEELIKANPEKLSAEMSEISSKMVVEWQASAKKQLVA